MQLYFVRHGESQANRLHIISNRDLPHGLTSTGQAQAAALAKQLSSVPITHIFTSPLLRATQTAKILSDILGLPYQITDALREYDCGILEGKSDQTSWQHHRQLRIDWLHHHRWEQRIDQGESFHDIQGRFLPFIYQLVQQFQSTDSNLLLMGHGGLYACMLPLILENIKFTMADTWPFPHTGHVLATLKTPLTNPPTLFCQACCGTPVAAPGSLSP